VRTGPRRLDPDPQRQPFTEVRNLPSIAHLSGREQLLRLPDPAERPLDPWTFLLDEWLNVPEGEMVWNYYLHTVGIHLDSRM
jgi:hypothetical protein